MNSVKEEARRLVEQLSESATWDDLMEEIYIRQVIEHGLQDSEAGRITPVEDVLAKFGQPS